MHHIIIRGIEKKAIFKNNVERKDGVQTLSNKETMSPCLPGSLFGYLLLVAKGFCMGASDVVPGVSGGTMAFILGIYEELINAVKSFGLKSLKLLLTGKIRALLDHVPWQFITAVGLGILTAIFSLANVISWLLQNRPVIIWSFFFGLILASVVSVSRRVAEWRPGTLLCLSAGITGTYFIVGLVPVNTPDDYWFILICGAIAVCAMILPGISGSFVLLLLGKYRYVLDAVNSRDFFVLFLVAAGACVGLASFSRLLGWLLKKHHDLMVAMLTGLMLGSLRKVWPWKETAADIVDMHGRMVPVVQSNILPKQWNSEVLIAVSMVLTGLLVVLLLERIGKK